mgnify:CR=1 FL=1
MPESITYNMDCMEAMRRMPDKCFDLAVVDPPYYSNAYSIITPGGNLSTTGVERRKYKMPHWEPPDEEYFNELFRVSKEQIIWGINYFPVNPGWGRIVWDKCKDNGTGFSDCEIAYCSQIKHVKIFRFLWNGMIQGTPGNGTKAIGNKRLNEVRIHPTQKPVALYRWIFKEFAKPGDKILDTHLGSGSSRIAAWDAGLDFTSYEIDKEYFEKQEERFAAHAAQMSMFLDTQ